MKNLIIQAQIEIEQCQNLDALELVRIKYLGKKGYFSQQINLLRYLPPEARAISGAVINQAKKELLKIINKQKIFLKHMLLEVKNVAETIDISLPGRHIETGGLHPVSLSIIRIEDFFRALGFAVINGPEIEDHYYNFDALNIPVHHPARTDHDTFWFDTVRLLRTQTSGVQIRTIQSQQPPIRIISSGRVYRNDYDQTHTPMFHQMEGLIIDLNISFTNLKELLYNFLYNFFEKKLQFRFRPSYFPFTEPSAEVDVMGENNQWLEVLGCGMVQPNILDNLGINHKKYSGLAFGMGIERLTMLRYGIKDLRVFFENDLRFLKQFK